VAMITRQPSLGPKWIPKRLGRLTVDQFEAMVDSDVFTKHDHFMLINGYLVTKVTKKPPHVIAGELIRDELIGLVPRNDWRVMVEAPVDARSCPPRNVLVQQRELCMVSPDRPERR
jgi:hypothetical protein